MISTPLFIAGGVAWTSGVTLVATAADSDPVGSGYDGFNRVFTVALVLVAAGALKVAREQRSTRARLMAGGTMAMLAGNLLEFWGSLIAGQPAAATAERLGEAEGFAGSTPGFALFALGSLLFVGSTIAVAVAAGGSRGRRSWAGAAGLFAAATTGLWAVSPAAAAVAGAAFASAWLLLGQAATGQARA